jgi:heterodisulfide reductase subunit A-like polyferredoxin
MTLQVEEQDTKNMKIVNDLGCSWINDLDKRSNIKTLDKDKSCDWLIVGAGYTGLSAARKLSELHPNQKIFIMERLGILFSKAVSLKFSLISIC